jgi:hypothetical protein
MCEQKIRRLWLLSQCRPESQGRSVAARPPEDDRSSALSPLARLSANDEPVHSTAVQPKQLARNPLRRQRPDGGMLKNLHHPPDDGVASPRWRHPDFSSRGRPLCGQGSTRQHRDASEVTLRLQVRHRRSHRPRERSGLCRRPRRAREGSGGGASSSYDNRFLEFSA